MKDAGQNQWKMQPAGHLRPEREKRQKSEQTQETHNCDSLTEERDYKHEIKKKTATKGNPREHKRILGESDDRNEKHSGGQGKSKGVFRESRTEGHTGGNKEK